MRQLLNHTSGLPDYTQSEGSSSRPDGPARLRLAAATIIGWVRDDPLVFTPGSRYAYSNTDNIVVGLIAEAVTGKPYGRLLREIVFGPAGLRETSFPTRGRRCRAPFLHGYVVAPGQQPRTSARS